MTHSRSGFFMRSTTLTHFSMDAGRDQMLSSSASFKAKGRTDAERNRVIAEAVAADEAGCFAMVIEGVAEDLAAQITRQVSCPTVGIGASATCDGQMLVTDDMLGMFDWTPRFVRRYADLRHSIAAAVDGYAADVRARAFPGEKETYILKKAP